MIDTVNKFLVASNGRGLAIMNPPSATISADEALLMAAYLVAMAEHDATHDFAEVLAAVQNT